MQKSIKYNSLLNISRTILYILFPLISLPYATRILGVENIGSVNYGSSIVSYFSLIAALGISTYAIREGSKIREDRIHFSIFANEVFSINLASTLFAYIFLVILVTFVPKLGDYRLLILIQSISIILTTVGVEWINVIYEDFLFVTIRSIVAQCISLLLLFLLVKNRSDYYMYAIITVISNAVISVSNYIHCKKYCSIKVTSHLNIHKHLKPILVFFSNNVTISIYVNSDTTILGWMYGDYFVGLYSVAVKVYSMLKTIIVALYNTTLSRLTFYISNNREKEYYNLLQKILKALLLLLIPEITGLFVLSDDIIYILAGNNYIEAAVTLKILSVGIFFAVMGGFVTSCVNIPNGHELISLKASILSAIINVLLNLFMIPLWKQNGAAVTTVIAEFTICAFYGFKSPMLKNIRIEGLLKTCRDSFVGLTIVIFTNFCIRFNLVNNNYLIHSFVVTVCSMVQYSVYLFLVRNDVVYPVMKNILSKVIK